MKSSFTRFKSYTLAKDTPDFCIIGMMRSGSNYLEELLNAHPQISCYGEIFNPSISYNSKTRVQKISRLEDGTISQAALDNYLRVYSDLSTKEKWGFRIFIDHDERVLYSLIAESSITKIVLYRGLLESFVSLLMAKETGQWKLTSEEWRVKDEIRINIDIKDFTTFICRTTLFYNDIITNLVNSRSKYVLVDYLSMVNGKLDDDIFNILGLKDRLSHTGINTLKQNTLPLEERISNYREVLKAMMDMKIARWLF